MSAVWDHFLAWARHPHPLTWGIVLGGLSLWLMLPRGSAKGRSLGVVLGIAALGCLGSRLLPLGPRDNNVVFWILSGVTIASASCTVTFRSPVYCAVWFALTLVGTAGIFMLQGAQFLAAATIVVYAGAILVTFLFVLMLAQPGGDAYYDRVSWEGLLAAATGAVLLGILSLTVGKLNLDKTAGPAAETLTSNVLTPDHVARLGAELFGRHLIAVEVAGSLLLVALVGATAIVSAQRGSVPDVAGRDGAAKSQGGGPMNGMHEAALLQNSLLVGAALFSIGLVGFLSRRNMIVMFLCAEMMLQGVSVSLVAWGRWHNNWDAQILVIFILTVAACEAAIALALVLMLFQRRGGLDIAAWDDLRESNLPPYADQELPEVAEPQPQWPHLTPAGAEPKIDEEEVLHRDHV